MDWRRELRCLRVGKRLFVLVVRKWRHENVDAQVTGLTDRLKRIDAIEDRFLQFIKLADDVTAQSRLVEQHRRVPWPRHKKREAFNRSIPAKIFTVIPVRG